MRLKAVILVFVVAAWCISNAALADTVAYWRFEEGPVDTQVGQQPDFTILDSSGNGNNMTSWAHDWASAAYRSDVPVSPIPGTGAVNTLSVQNVGGYPALFTNSAVTSPSGTDLETWTPLTWTIEASYKPEDTNGFRTVVGRDGLNVCTADGTQALVYLSVLPDNNVAVRYVDVTGLQHVAISDPGLITGGFDASIDPTGSTGTWYSLAATCDGSKLSLYLDNALVAQTDIVSTDARMSNGVLADDSYTDGSDWHHGGWSVMRGLWNGGHVDRAYGFIDEVRISDVALDPSEFLMVPEPATYLMLVIASALCLMYRRFRRK
jgi:hypothetical protein